MPLPTRPIRLPIKLDTSGWDVEPWHVIVAATVAGVLVAVLLFVMLALVWRVPPIPERVVHKRPAGVIAGAVGASSVGSASWGELSNGCLFSGRGDGCSLGRRA